MKRLSAVVALLLLPASAPAATEMTADFSEERKLDFGLRFSRVRNTLDYGGTTHVTTVKTAGVGWREPFGPVQIGLRLGLSTLAQDGNSSTRGLDLDGYHAGLSLAFDVVRHDRGRLFASADYLYQRVDHEGTIQKVRMSWTDPRAHLGLTHALTRQLHVVLGASYGRISGRERLDNGAISTRHFSRNDGGSFLGLDIVDSDKGTVGFLWRTGLDRGGSITFKRVF
jgi:hypothetical protein